MLATQRRLQSGCDFSDSARVCHYQKGAFRRVSIIIVGWSGCLSALTVQMSGLWRDCKGYDLHLCQALPFLPTLNAKVCMPLMIIYMSLEYMLHGSPAWDGAVKVCEPIDIRQRSQLSSLLPENWAGRGELAWAQCMCRLCPHTTTSGRALGCTRGHCSSRVLEWTDAQGRH